MREKRFRAGSVAETMEVAAALAALLPAPQLVVLRGELGAGKTTLVKGWVAALGAGAAEEVTSPTFTLVHAYRSAAVQVYHLDLYRLETERELATLGLEEMAGEPDALLLVEWGERFASVVARADAEVAMTVLDGEEREFVVRWG